MVLARSVVRPTESAVHDLKKVVRWSVSTLRQQRPTTGLVQMLGGHAPKTSSVLQSSWALKGLLRLPAVPQHSIRVGTVGALQKSRQKVSMSTLSQTIEDWDGSVTHRHDTCGFKNEGRSATLRCGFVFSRTRVIS